MGVSGVGGDGASGLGHFGRGEYRVSLAVLRPVFRVPEATCECRGVLHAPLAARAPADAEHGG